MPSPSSPRPEVTGAERTARYQTLSHPVRRRIMQYIGHYGEANSTSVAKALNESTGTTSYHLRKLAELQLIEEIAERSTGRERWWRSLPVWFKAPPSPSEMSPEELIAAKELYTLKLGHDIELCVRAFNEYDGPEGWAQTMRFGASMTKDELHQFYREYQALIAKYGRHPTDAPEGAKPIAVRLFAVPEEPPPGPPPEV